MEDRGQAVHRLAAQEGVNAGYDRPPAIRVQPVEADPQTHWLPIGTLLPGDSPRLDGEDSEHVRMLADSDSELSPIIVHRSTMRIIDGMHRLRAALIRGDALIQVRYFEGSAQEAFVLAVRANITHGRPLSLRDRTAAAERIINDHPGWSDRAIAAAVGLGARTVGGIRRRTGTTDDTAHEAPVRVGLDGRVRPLDNAEGRLRAAAIVRSNPHASLREIARQAGVSPTTVRDVRKRMQRGDDPVPLKHTAHRANVVSQPVPAGHPPQPALSAMLKGLLHDPSLRFSESGRTLVRWIWARAIRFEEWQEVSREVPSHASYIIADVARRFADEWLHIADELEKQ
jgi:ParB-like chromosome segregation protein Spo0J